MQQISLKIISFCAGIVASMSYADEYQVPWSGEVLVSEFPDSLPPIGHLRVPYSKMTEASPPYPSCFFVGGLCGYVNYRGETVISPEYHSAREFEGDWARVSRSNLVGFIDLAGVPVFPVAYDYLSDPHLGAVMARKGETTALITLEGERLFETDQDVAILLDESHVLVGSFDSVSPRPTTDPFYMASIALNRQVVNIKTGAALDLPNGSTRIYATEHGLVMVVGGLREDPAYIYDATGEVTAGPFEYVRDYGNGLFPAKVDGRWGAIDVHGEVIIDFQFDSLGAFYDADPEGWAVFSQDGKFGYVDIDGVVQIPAQFENAHSLNADDAAIVTLEESKFEIGRDGERLDACLTTPLVVLTESKNYRVLSSPRVPLNDVLYDFAETSCGDPTLVILDGEYWFLNDDGSPLNDEIYTRAIPFRDGVALVYVSATHGTIIDSSGVQLFDPVFIEAKVISNSGATINPGPAYVKLTSEVAEGLAFDPSLLTMPDPHALPDGVCRDGVRVLERYRNGQIQQTYYDVNGDAFLHGVFDYASCFSGQTSWVGIPSRQEFCEINREGTVDLSTCDCREPAKIFDASYDYPDGFSCYERGLWVMRSNERLPTISHF